MLVRLFGGDKNKLLVWFTTAFNRGKMLIVLSLLFDVLLG